MDLEGKLKKARKTPYLNKDGLMMVFRKVFDAWIIIIIQDRFDRYKPGSLFFDLQTSIDLTDNRIGLQGRPRIKTRTFEKSAF